MPINDPSPVRVCAGAALGVGAAVLPGVTIGARAVVGPGSVVTRDVAPGVAVLGNPARVVRVWDESLGEWVSGPGG
jgi:acetyltransferase-like isoleucine patch superfamily enzyme